MALLEGVEAAIRAPGQGGDDRIVVPRPSPLTPLPAGERGIVILLLLSTLLIPAVHAAGEIRQIWGAPFRSSPLDLAIDGTNLWASDSYGVRLYDASIDPPRVVASLALPAATTRVRVLNGLAYVGSGTKLYVVSKSAERLTMVGSVEIGGSINDILVATPYLFVAASNGITQLDLLVPGSPAIAGPRLTTTSGGARSLARKDATLYAADGDATIEAYSIAVPSLPQRIGTFSSLPQSLSVAVNADRIYVSDGQQTELFAGSGTSVAKIGSARGIGSTSFVPVTLSVAWVAGTDRTVRAVDFRDAAAPVVLWDSQVGFATGGTINRVTALAAAGNRLWVAGGDSGLSVFDTSGFVAPYPVRNHPVGSTRSVLSFGNAVVSAPDAGGMKLFTQNETGSLTFVRELESSRVWTIHDGRSMRVLASSGSTLSFWDLIPTVPILVSTVTLPSDVRSAILVDQIAYAVLNDRTLWRIDLGNQNGAFSLVSIAGASPSFIERSSSGAIAIADLDAAGTTTVRFWPSLDFTSTPKIITIEGAATSGIALSSTGLVAASTFRGLTTIDFAPATPIASQISSVGILTRDLHFTGEDLSVLRTSGIDIWRPSTKTMIRSWSFTTQTIAVHSRPEAGSILSIATSDGVTSVLTDFSTTLPSSRGTTEANTFFRRLQRDADHLLLFDGRAFESFLLGTNGLPLSSNRFGVTGDVVAFAAVDGRICTLESNGRLALLDTHGVVIAESSVKETPDTQPLGIVEVAGALYVSISKGCLSGGCEKRTIVFDPRGGVLIRTAEMSGGVVDADFAGTRGWSLVDLPAEIRVLDLTDPYRPIVLTTRPSEGNPVSIAVASSVTTVYVLGVRLKSYRSDTLEPVIDLLEPWSQDPSGRLSYLDQRVRIDGSVALIAGRTFQPQIFNVSSSSIWTPISSPPVPAAVKEASVRSGQFHLLSDYSLEIWSTEPATKRKRGVR